MIQILAASAAAHIGLSSDFLRRQAGEIARKSSCRAAARMMANDYPTVENMSYADIDMGYVIAFRVQVNRGEPVTAGLPGDHVVALHADDHRAIYRKHKGRETGTGLRVSLGGLRTAEGSHVSWLRGPLSVGAIAGLLAARRLRRSSGFERCARVATYSLIGGAAVWLGLIASANRRSGAAV